MSTKKLLLLAIPFLLVLNSVISYIIFQSSYSVNESYQKMLARVLLFQSIDDQVQEQFTLIAHYVEQQDSQLLEQLTVEQQSLQNLQLIFQQQNEQLSLGKMNYLQLLHNYYDNEAQLLASLEQFDKLAYTTYYDNLSHLEIYINEDTNELIQTELSDYQQIFSKLFVEVSKMKTTGFYLILTTTLLSLWLVYWISTRITTPIRELVTVADQISIGNWDTPIPQYEKSSDFYILGEAFASMKHNVTRLMESEKATLEKDKQLKELELEVLQNQINPHFLFNSLNVISKLALIEGAEQTSDLTVAMSNLLRYHLRKMDQPVPLADEVKHSKEYFFIQQARFRNRVLFQLDIDEQQLATRVPVLTLQPILENIFVHGIEDMESGATITLRIFGDDTYTWIEISDNGSGMDELTRQHLLTYSSPLESTARTNGSSGIGSRNVFRRLYLLYGDEHQVDIYSEIGKGTTIKLRIPKHQKENDHVSNINS